MKRQKENRKSIPIRIKIMITFITLMVSTVFGIVYIIFNQWTNSTEVAMEKLTNGMDDNIYHEIDMLMSEPLELIHMNKGLIEQGVIKMDDEEEREKFFAEVLDVQCPELYSFTYGSQTGEYYGARRNEENNIEIIRKNKNTNWETRYYSLNEDKTVDQIVLRNEQFEARARIWYITAMFSDKPIFSPVYQHAFEENLAISAAIPIYNKREELQGVLGARVTLSNINQFLENVSKEEHATAIVVEKETGYLIGNSFGQPNHKVLPDGTLERVSIYDLDLGNMNDALDTFKKNDKDKETFTEKDGGVHIHLTEYQQEGLEWIVITAIPTNIFMEEIYQSIGLASLLIIAALALSIAVYLFLTNRLLHPMSELIETTDQLAQGNLKQRATVYRNDEIGIITKAINKMAEMLDVLINRLENIVDQRTKEIDEARKTMKEHKDQLQLILDSTVEAIYGMNLEGNCTFCNQSGLRLLGYEKQEDLLGVNIHYQIHHSYRDGKPMKLEDCKVFAALMEGKGAHADDEVFWRADGTPMDVEYHSYPQYKDGELVGAVVTFLDNSERRKQEANIRYLSNHDTLTGLHNRKCLVERQEFIDREENLPISIIYGDVNGLKLTNDIFGHAAGDELLMKVGKILKDVRRKGDLAVRMGGDEFVVLLPKTDGAEADQIMKRIKDAFARETIKAIKGNISMGRATKTELKDELQDIIEEADEKMYLEKTTMRKYTCENQINKLLTTLYAISPREKEHSYNVREYSRKLGMRMGLSESNMKRLARAAYLHDIGKIALDENTIIHMSNYTGKENREIKQHTVIGYRILNSFDETLDLAGIVYAHHERWDGQGYPVGLKGKEIPLLARMIAVVETYDTIVHEPVGYTKKEALQVLQSEAGIKYDPEVVKAFVEMMED